MKELKDLSAIEVTEVYQGAISWAQKHKKHVDTLIKDTEWSYPPSGSDIFRPELWKSAHWKWFKSHR